MRRTLKSPAKFSGVGLHGGQAAVMRLLPAQAGDGIAFIRTDVPEELSAIPARYDLVVDTMLCTKLGNRHGVTVGTVEHVMAALAGCGITDCVIELDGPEVPIMDGSSAPFVAAIREAGVKTISTACRAIRILREVRVEVDGKTASLAPADRFEMDFQIAFDDPAIGTQRRNMTLVNGAFASDLSDSRTFGHLHEVEHLRKLGLARGGSLQNAIVVENGRVLNPEGLRHSDEFVRHKMLDAVGDLALAGAPIIGRYTGVKAGHDMTNRLLHALFAEPDAWEWVQMVPGQGMGGTLTTPPTSREVEAAAG